jgi:hypothetical protein
MKQLIILILLISLSKLAVAQSNFYKQYSSNGYDFGQGIVGLPDSSYVITGTSSSFTEGPAQMFLLKVDSLGNFIWSNHYGGSETDGGRRVKYIEGEGFFVGGYTNSSGHGAYDFALWKIDENGNEEWFKTYGTIGWERIHHMAITADNGVILVGETNNTTDGFTDIYIVRTDHDGTVLWEKQIENPGDDNALTIKQFDNSTFIVGGYFYNSSSGFKQAWLTKLEDDGTELWTQVWGDDYDFDIADIEMYNQQIVSVGARTTVGDDEERWFILKVDSDGAVLTSWFELTLNHFKAVGITTHDNLGVFSICTSYSGTEFSYGLEDLYVYAFTHSPSYLGQLGGVNYATSQVFGEMITTYNRGTIMTGYNENIGPGGSSIFILRMGKGQPYSDAGDDFTTTPLISVEQVSSSETITIYPNPSTDKIRIKSEDSDGQLFLIRINDLSGRKILSLETHNLNQTVIDASMIAKGVYTMIIENESNTAIRKIEIR